MTFSLALRFGARCHLTATPRGGSWKGFNAVLSIRLPSLLGGDGGPAKRLYPPPPTPTPTSQTAEQGQGVDNGELKCTWVQLTGHLLPRAIPHPACPKGTAARGALPLPNLSSPSALLRWRMQSRPSVMHLVQRRVESLHKVPPPHVNDMPIIVTAANHHDGPGAQGGALSALCGVCRVSVTSPQTPAPTVALPDPPSTIAVRDLPTHCSPPPTPPPSAHRPECT